MKHFKVKFHWNKFILLYFLNSGFFPLLGKILFFFNPSYLGQSILSSYQNCRAFFHYLVYCLQGFASCLAGSIQFFFVNLWSASIWTWPVHFHFADFVTILFETICIVTYFTSIVGKPTKYSFTSFYPFIAPEFLIF